MSRLDEIDEFLNHEPCCDHADAEPTGCWDCLNTGHTHSQHIESEDAKALVRFAKAVRSATLDRHITYADTDELVIAALEELEQDT